LINRCIKKEEEYNPILDKKQMGKVFNLYLNQIKISYKEKGNKTKYLKYSQR